MLPCTPGISDSRTHAPTLHGSCGGSITVDSVHSDPLDTVGSPPTHVIAVSYAIVAAYVAHSLETCGWDLRKVDSWTGCTLSGCMLACKPGCSSPSVLSYCLLVYNLST